MKKRIRFLACFLAAAFLLSCTGAFADFQSSNALTERMAVETASNLAYNRILEYYGEEAYMLPNESLREVTSQHSSIPDYGDVYAGAYLNEDGKLVVLLANGQNGDISAASATQSNILSSEIQRNSTAFSALPAALKTEATTLSSIAQCNDLIFQQAKYSYSYLQSLNMFLLNQRDNFNNNCMSSDSIWQDIVGFGIKDDTNSIMIHIVNINENKIDHFKQEVLDSDAIIFENSDGSWGSIGYKATRYLSGGGTQTGFVTAAHVVSSGLVRYRTNPGTNSWANVGYVRTAQNGGTVDAAFVEITESSVNLTNRVFNSTGTSISSGYITPAVGSTVCMSGDASRTYNYGSVISTSYNGKAGYSDFVLASYSRNSGDSGGIVFATSGGASKAVGIHHGYVTADGAVRAVYCKVANIAQVLNVSPIW